MKKYIILFTTILLLTACFKLKSIDISSLGEIKKLKDNKDNISQVIAHRITNGSDNCYLLNKKDVYNIFDNAKLAYEKNISVADDYLTYTFYFNNNEELSFNFESKYFRYKNKNYLIKNFNRPQLKEENIVSCEK